MADATTASLHTYSDEFYNYIETGAQRSAEVVVRSLLTLTQPASVLDVGCGRGVWLREWNRAGIQDFFGMDGSYVDTDRLAIPAARFAGRDLSQPVDLGRRFDLVQSLEVAEHIRESNADTFIDTLCRHGDAILFSAAVKGQGGEGHINEQPLDYWRQKFVQRGYAAYDCLRPAIARRREIEQWYRYNTLLYVRNTIAPPATIAATRLDPSTPVPDVSPLAWRVRKAMLRSLPRSLIEFLALAKHRLHNLIHPVKALLDKVIRGNKKLSELTTRETILLLGGIALWNVVLVGFGYWMVKDSIRWLG